MIINEELLNNIENYLEEYYYDKDAAQLLLETLLRDSNESIKFSYQDDSEYTPEELEQIKRERERKERQRKEKEAAVKAELTVQGQKPYLGRPRLSRPQESVFRQKLDFILKILDDSFSERLFKLIDERGMTDAEVYKAARLDRRLFSKIRSNRKYLPSKHTVFALIMALKLNMEDADDLLKRAGYAFSYTIKEDVILQYFIDNEQYDIDELNEVLHYYDLPTLG